MDESESTQKFSNWTEYTPRERERLCGFDRVNGLTSRKETKQRGSENLSYYMSEDLEKSCFCCD